MKSDQAGSAEHVHDTGGGGGDRDDGGDELNKPTAGREAAAAAAHREDEEEEEEEEDGGMPTKATAAAGTTAGTAAANNAAAAAATSTAAISRGTVVSGFAPRRSRSRSSSSTGAGRTTSRPGAYHVPGIGSSGTTCSSRADASSDVAAVQSAEGGGGAIVDADDDTADVHWVEAMTVPVAPPESLHVAPADVSQQSMLSYSHDSGDAASLLQSQLAGGSLQRSTSTFTGQSQSQVRVQVAEPMSATSLLELGSVANTEIVSGSALSASEAWTNGGGSSNQQEEQARRDKSDSGSSDACSDEGGNNILLQKKYCLPLIALLVFIAVIVGITVPLVSRGITDSDGTAGGHDGDGDGNGGPSSPFAVGAPTASPVDAGAEEERREFALYVENLLGPIYYDQSQGDNNILGDPTSPQSLALDWVVSQDAYSRQAYTYRSCANVDVDSIVLQRYVLAVTYYSTDGANWDDRLGFLSEDTAACDWNVYDDAEKSLVGVAECDINASENTTTEGLSNICQETDVFYSPITSLVLARNGLLGTIPSELGLLSGLKVLDLSTNTLESIIPSQLAQISSTLEQIVLGDNGLVGSIPAEIFLDSPSLWRLSIWSNGLTGTLPTTLGKCTSLEVISLANNQLTGSLPTEIGHLSRLKDVIIWSNQFTGSIPTELGNCQSLEIYSAPINLMTGTFPTELGQLTNLTIVFAYENIHTGQIPTELGNLRKLEVFNVAINNLSGTLPTEIGQVSSLRRFRYFDNTGISGTVPSEITSLPLLEDVWVTNTQLGGPFPSVFHPESRIRSIHAEKSAFTGTVPTEIWSLSRFDELQIINTTMTGSPIPDVLPEGNNVAQMSFVTLTGNDFSGTLPSIIGSFQSLTKLLLQNNAFSGDVPSELSNLQSLVELQMQGNDFDSVPPSMCNLRNASGGGMLEIYVSDCDEVGCTCCSECL